MKIVFFDFVTLNYGGGCELHFLKLGKWLKDKGNEVTFITGSYSLNNLYTVPIWQKRHSQNISDEELKKHHGVNVCYKFSLKDLLLPTKNRKLIRKFLNSADAIISRNELFEMIILKFIFRSNQKIVLYELKYPSARILQSKIHNLLYNSKLYGFFLNKTKIRALTADQEKVIKKITNKPCIRVIPNGINISKFNQKSYKKRRYFKVYYVGRMTEPKGIDVLYQVIQILSKREEFKNMKFYFVGACSEEHFLKRLEKSFSNCNFIGFQLDVINYYHDADIIVAPSRWEGFPFVLLEAQACGTPIVTTRAEGCREIVSDGKNGWIANIDDDRDIANKIVEAYLLWKNDFQNFVKIGKSGRQNAVQKYDDNVINHKILGFVRGSQTTLQ